MMNAELNSETLSPHEVAGRVRPYVTGKHVGDIALRMDDARIHLRNCYWNIPVRPSRWPNPLFPYYETLAEIEDEVSRKGRHQSDYCFRRANDGGITKSASVAFCHQIGLNYVSCSLYRVPIVRLKDGSNRER